MKSIIENEFDEHTKVINSTIELVIDDIESAANIVTIVLKSPLEAEIMCSELLKRGVIVRHLKGFGWPECVRVSIGTIDENLFFIENLKNYIKV